LDVQLDDTFRYEHTVTVPNQKHRAAFLRLKIWVPFGAFELLGEEGLGSMVVNLDEGLDTHVAMRLTEYPGDLDQPAVRCLSGTIFVLGDLREYEAVTTNTVPKGMFEEWLEMAATHAAVACVTLPSPNTKREEPRGLKPLTKSIAETGTGYAGRLLP